MTSDRWQVLRHGGRRNDVERLLYSGDDEIRARDIFRYWREKLRQGSVRLTDSQVGTVDLCRSPRLKTRW